MWDLSAGTHRGKSSGAKTRFEDSDRFRGALDKFVKAYAKLFEGEYEGFGASSIRSLRRQLDGVVSGVVTSGNFSPYPLS